MKVFLSHSSKDKPLVREIRRSLPTYITTWIDEDQLHFDKDLSVTLENTISVHADFVVLFLSDDSASSDWVNREIVWAVEKEKHMEDPFLLVINMGVDDRTISDMGLSERQYLKHDDYSEEGVRTTATKLTNSLAALITRRLDRMASIMRHQESIIRPSSPSVRSIETGSAAETADIPEALIERLLRNARLRLICAADVERSHRIKRDGSPN